MNLTHDVYFCYSREDSPGQIKKIMDWFAQKGKRIFEKNYPGTKSSQRESKDAFLDSANIILLISEYSFTDEQFSSELNLLKNTGKKAFILQIDNNFQPDWLTVIPAYCKSEIYDLPSLEKDWDAIFEELLELIDKGKEIASMHSVLAKAAYNWSFHSNAIQNNAVGESLSSFEQIAEYLSVHYTANLVLTDLIYAYAAELKVISGGGVRDVYFAYSDEVLTTVNEIFVLSLREKLSVWMANKVGISAKNLNDEVKAAIENTSSFVFFITQASVADEDMLEQLRYAQSFNKRIIPVLLEKVVKKTIPSDVRKLVMLDLTSEDPETRKIAIDKIVSVMLKDKELVNMHRDYLVKALQWERSGYQLKYLLRGFELEKATTWLDENSARSDYAPISLHQRFISESSKAKLTVFISYGRKQSKYLAQRLHDRLSLDNYDVWFDQNDIPLAVDFQEQINRGIEKSDNFIFIISPHSVKSVYCLKEIKLAVELRKRIIPILHVEPQNQEEYAAMHPVIAKLNWMHFKEVFTPDLPLEQWTAIDSFDQSYTKLRDLIETHTDYVKQHTVLLLRALEWVKNQRSPKFLLEGSERLEADAWLAKEFKNEQPPNLPTVLHGQFISESRKQAEWGMADVYISFANENKATRDYIYEKLVVEGYTVTDSSEIVGSNNFTEAMHEAIEKSNTLLALVSSTSVISDYCLEEISHASIFNMRIILLMVEDVPRNKMIEELRQLKPFDFSYSNLENHDSVFSELMRELERDKEYFQQHKIIFTFASRWKKQNQNSAMLFRGFQLETAELWLKQGLLRDSYQPTALQIQFLQSSRVKSNELSADIYIAFSKSDFDFANRIQLELRIHGKITWFEHMYIAKDSNYNNELFKGIEEAPFFLFIISPEAVKNQQTLLELSQAVSLNKKIIPIVYKQITRNELPPALRDAEHIGFTTDFHTSFSDMMRVIDLDRDYLTQLQRWQKKAKEWESSNKSNDFLLPAAEVDVSMLWLAEVKSYNKVPAPDKLLEEFIFASHEFLQLKKQKAKRRSKLLVGLLSFALSGLVLSILLLLYALAARQEAVDARNESEKLREQAIVAQKNAERQNKVLKLALYDPEKARIFITTEELKNQINDLELEENDMHALALKNQMRSELLGLQASLANNLFDLGDFTSAFDISNERVDNARKLNKSSTQIAGALAMRGLFRLYLGQTDSAMLDFTQSLGLDAGNDTAAIGSIIGNLITSNTSEAKSLYTLKAKKSSFIPVFWHKFNHIFALYDSLPGNTYRREILGNYSLKQLQNFAWMYTDSALATSKTDEKAFYYNVGLQFALAANSIPDSAMYKVSSNMGTSAFYYLLAGDYELVILLTNQARKYDSGVWLKAMQTVAYMLTTEYDNARQLLSGSDKLEVINYLEHILMQIQYSGHTPPNLQKIRNILDNQKRN